MPQQEGKTNYKYEDYASEMAFHRLPQTAALLNQTMKITLDSGTSFDLEFADRNKVIWESGSECGTDWCEVVEVASQTYFIDMTFTHQPRQSQTFIVSTETRQALAVRTIMREGDVGKEPRAVHQFSPGVLGDPAIPPAGRKPAPTRDLIGLRALYTYNPNQCFEHIYLNSQRYAWHCVVGPLRGEADVDFHTTYKFDDNQYIFCFREFGLPVSTVFFHNWDQMRETGKFFAIGEDGAFANTPAGALIKKLSMAFYPLDMQPI
ncbi:MAG: molybdenum cofactor biosynthesis protein F [Deltaproteobacteria bacterium]|nr:molybdenum cofactor biosynthesis protein F [Deltaproteobacteria bacterium]